MLHPMEIKNETADKKRKHETPQLKQNMESLNGPKDKNAIT